MEDKRTIKRKTGDAGEDAACSMLIRSGYRIITRNWSCKTGEIDIVAVHPDRGILAFVEVKTRRNTDHGFPSEFVGKEKQRRIRRSAEWFLLTDGRFRDLQPSFDVIEILRTDIGLFGRHLQNAF